MVAQSPRNFDRRLLGRQSARVITGFVALVDVRGFPARCDHLQAARADGRDLCGKDSQ